MFIGEIITTFNQCACRIITLLKLVNCLQILLRWVLWPMGLLYFYFLFFLAVISHVVYLSGETERICDLRDSFHVLGNSEFYLHHSFLSENHFEGNENNQNCFFHTQHVHVAKFYLLVKESKACALKFLYLNQLFWIAYLLF